MLHRRSFVAGALASYAGLALPPGSPAHGRKGSVHTIPQREMIESGKKRLLSLLGNDVYFGCPDEFTRFAVTKYEDGQLDISHAVEPIDRFVSSYAHLGWPVACRVADGSVVIVFKRGAGHGCDDECRPRPDEKAFNWVARFSSKSFTFSSWTPASPVRGSGRINYLDGMHAVGSTSRAAVRTLLISARTEDEPFIRFHISPDHGRTWNSAGAFIEGPPPASKFAHIGPNLCRHDEFGDIAILGRGSSNPFANVILRSLDGGDHWDWHEAPSDGESEAVEPSMLVFGHGHILILAREWNADFVGDSTLWPYSQKLYVHKPRQDFSGIYFTSRRTNIGTVKEYGQEAQDTPELIFNPVTQRIEAVVSNRMGAGEFPERAVTAREKFCSMALWSINPEDLIAGSSLWRYEGELLRRRGFSRIGSRDGFHPGGSVVDEREGLHHVFFYSGWRGYPEELGKGGKDTGPSGIFRMTRTLETGVLFA